MLSICASLLFLTQTPTQLPTFDATQQPTPAPNTHEDVQVMRRLLVKALGPVNAADPWGNLLPTDETQLGFTGLIGSQRGPSNVTHSRGFYLPRSGAFFSIDLKVAVREVEAEKPEDPSSAKKADDEWERARREVRGGRTQQAGQGIPGGHATMNTGLLGVVRTSAEKRWVLDPDAINDATDAVLETLAKHGSRIGDMASEEHLTVAIHLTGGNGTSFGNVYPSEQSTVNWSMWVTAYGAQAAEQHLVIQVARRDVTDYSGGTVPLAELKRRAIVYRY